MYLNSVRENSCRSANNSRATVDVAYKYNNTCVMVIFRTTPL